MSVTLWARPPAAGARPGRDVVLSAASGTAGGMPDGTLLDDHLDAEARVAVEGEARVRAAAWTAARRDELVVAGIRGHLG